MKNRTALIASTLLFAAIFACSTPAFGQTLNWDPLLTGSANGSGAGTWSTTANWFNGTSDVAWTSGGTAVFGGASGGIVTLGANQTVGGMTFNTSGYNIPKSGSDTITLSGAPTITLGNGVTATISNLMTGSGTPLTISGSGTLVLGTTNTYTGGTFISAGSAVVLTALTNGVNPNPGLGLGTGPITNNGVLTVNPGVSVSAGNITFANTVVGTNAVVNFENGSFISSGSWANFNGTGTINILPTALASSVQITTAAPLTPAGTTWNIGYGQTFTIGFAGASNPSTIIINGPGGAINANLGAFRMDNGTQTGPVLLAGTNNWIGSFQGTVTYSGPISDSGSGNGVVVTSRPTSTRDIIIFAGTNTYTGLTTISNGTLRLGIAENPGTSGPIGTSSLQFAGALGTVNCGTLQYSATNNYDYSGRITGAANQVYMIDVNSQAVSFGTPLTSVGGTLYLRDTAGGGTLTLNAANTYTGGTIISNNTTMVANVAGAIPGLVTLSGGTLVGNVSGGLSANVTLSAASAVLTLSNSAAMSQYAALTLPASPSASSVNLDFTGTQNISALYFGTSPQATGTYGAVGSTALNQSSTFTGTGILNVAVPAIANAYWDANGTDASSQSSANGGGTGIWNSANVNWWVSGGSDTTWLTYAANFAGATAGTVTLGANETAEGLTFTTSGYVVTNSSGAVLALSGAPTISVASGTATVGCPFTVGVLGLTAAGSGTLILTANDTNAGPLTVSNTLMISGSGKLSGGNYPGAITVPGSLVYSSTAAQTLAGAISDAGTGLGEITQQGSGTLTLSGANTYGGGTTIATNSTLVVGGATAKGAGTGAITNNGVLTVNANASLSSGNITFANDVDGTNTVVNYENGSYIQSGNWAGFAGTINILAAGSGTSVQITAPAALPPAGTWNIGNGQTFTIGVPGGTVNSSTIIINGPGGAINASLGALRFDSGTQTGPVLLAGTNNWIGSFQGTITYSGPISDMGSGNGVVVTSRPTSARDILIFAGTNTYTGLTTISNGTLQLGIAENPGTNGPLGTSTIQIPNTLSQGANFGVLQYSSVNQYDYSGRFVATANQAYGIDLYGQAVTFASPLTSAGGILLLLDTQGGGTLTLNATNTYSGGTIVSNGTLVAEVAGAVPGGGVRVANGTLVGNATGSIAGNVTLGDSGILTLSNSSAMSSAATLTLPASPSTQVNLNFSGTQKINSLYFGANQQISGLYGASALNPNGAFAGTGTLMVGSGPSITISSPTITANQFTISWNSVPGANYNVFATTNLNPPITWSNLTYGSPITASDTNTSYTVPGNVSGNLFLMIQQ